MAVKMRFHMCKRAAEFNDRSSGPTSQQTAQTVIPNERGRSDGWSKEKLHNGTRATFIQVYIVLVPDTSCPVMRDRLYACGAESAKGM